MPRGVVMLDHNITQRKYSTIIHVVKTLYFYRSIIALFSKIIGAVPFCIKKRTKCRSLHTVLPALFQIGRWMLSVGSFFGGGGGAGSISFFGVHFMVKLLKLPTAAAGYKFWKIGNSPNFFSLGALPPPTDPRAYGIRIHDPLYFYSYKLGI